MIEDDLDIANVLRMDLGDAGYAVEHADSAMNGLIRAREDHPDLILLDLGLPDFDGGDVVQRLRKNSAVPIIVLTARDTVDEKVRLLGLGADDYLIKPFHPDELLARVKVQLRQRVTESLTMGDLTLDPQRFVTFAVPRRDLLVGLATGHASQPYRVQVAWAARGASISA